MSGHDSGEMSIVDADAEPSEVTTADPALARRLARATVDGYHSSRPAERAAFGMISGFALALLGARKITYVQERRRDLPVLRGLGRNLPTLPRSDDIRVHHYLPGLGIAMATGGAAILAGSGGVERWLSMPFGVGVGLVFDEIGLLTGRDNPYWGAERFVLVSGVTATSAAAAMAAVFLHRGRRLA